MIPASPNTPLPSRSMSIPPISAAIPANMPMATAREISPLYSIMLFPFLLTADANADIIPMTAMIAIPPRIKRSSGIEPSTQIAAATMPTAAARSNIDLPAFCIVVATSAVRNLPATTASPARAATITPTVIAPFLNTSGSCFQAHIPQQPIFLHRSPSA